MYLVYDNKKNDLYYQEVVCERCGGSGQHSYTESRSLAGQYFDCRECNTIGKLKTLRPDFQMTLANTHTQETIDFLTYLFEVSSNKKPLFTIRPTEYKGTIYIYSKAAAGASNNTPVFVVTRRFSFLDKNGKPDVDATALTRVVDKQVHPLDQIEGFKFISGKEVFSNGTSVTTNNHIQILSNTGETFEFVTEQNESLVIKKLHQLLEIAKSKQRELNSGI